MPLPQGRSGILRARRRSERGPHWLAAELGRIPPGGGHRMLGRRQTEAWKKRHRPGYDYLHVAVDHHSRVAFVRAFSDEQGETAARFLLKAAGSFAEIGGQAPRVSVRMREVIHSA